MPSDDGGLARVAVRNEQVRNLLFPRQHRDGEDAADRPQFSVERQFADQQVVRKILLAAASP